MPSEFDPLLPKATPAPEISGYGFSASNNKSTSEEVDYQYRPTRLGGADNETKHEYNAIDIDELRQQEQRDEYRYFGERYAGDQQQEADNNGGDDSESSSQSNLRNRAFRQLGALFSFVVGFAILIALITPGGFGDGNGSSGPQPVPVPSSSPSSPKLSIPERATRILQETPLMDGHDDLAIFIAASFQNKLHSPEFKDKFESGGLDGHVDIPRLQKGMVGGGFWSAFVPCSRNASYDFSDSNYASSVTMTLSQIDLLHRLQSLYPDTFTSATTPLTSALKAFHSTHSLISPLSIEGLHQLPPSAPLSTLRLYYTLGVRAATLNWNCHNPFSDAALITDVDPETGKFSTVVSPNYRNGITPLGRKVITEMNRLGMLVDLSHTSYWTQISVLSNGTSRSPVIYSHSSVYNLCPHPRNVHDDALDLVKETNSLVMVNFNPDFVSCYLASDAGPLDMPTFYEKNSTVEWVVEHIKYIGNRIGYDHVGLGSDFDGIESTPRGLSDVSDFPRIAEILLESGVKDSDVAKVVGGNLIRVWKDADKVAEEMREEGIPEGEDPVKKGW